LAELHLPWRLLEDGITDPFLHFAVEETLLRRVSEGKSQPTFRLRQVTPCVFVGVFQDPREDADVDYCRTRGIDIVRRPNPGGAVYQDQGSFCYSAFFPKHPTFELLGIQETQDLYRIMGEIVVAWCKSFGISAKAAPVNDVEIGSRKVYGSAQVEMGTSIVHSGTFLVSTDIHVMEAALRPSRLKFMNKGFSSVRERVLNLSEAMKSPVDIREAMEHLVTECRQRMPIDLMPSPLTDEETREAHALCETKYARLEWTFPTRKPFSTTLSTKALSGVVILDLQMDGPFIEDVAVRGDFLIERQEQLASVSVSLKGKSIQEALEIVRQCSLPADISRALADLLEDGGHGHEGAES
jgi:lipoate---protein ligase